MIKKYKLKCRILLVNTPNYKDSNYLITKKMYQKEIKNFHKRFIKLIVKKSQNNFSLDLIGFDGQRQLKLKKLDIKKIFKKVDGMPISKKIQNKKIKPINLSLFSDYNPKTTTHGLGFKNKQKAIHTVKTIKSRNIKYQLNVISTMLGRAKKHPNQTRDMIEAIKVFNTWMQNYKKNKL